MRHPFCLLSSPLLLAAAFAFLPVGSALGQGKATVGKPSFDSLLSPMFNVPGTKDKGFKPKEWLEIESAITIPPQTPEQKQTGFIDSVLVKWYVAIKEKVSKKTMLLTAEVNHVNVPVDEQFYSSVYISPNTMKRLTGRDKGTKSQVDIVALEVLVNGVKVGEETTREKSGWWNSPNLGRGDRFPLVNKNHTPFRDLWWDRYAEIEERK